MSFRLAREAEEDVTNIYRYSFENFGEAQADTYHDGLNDCFRLLADTPLLGRDYGFLRPGLRRYEHASHSVYYQLTDRFRQLVVTDLVTEQQKTHSGLNAHRSGP